MKKLFSGKMRWISIGIIALAIAGAAFYYYTKSAQASTTAVTQIQTASAFRGNIVLQASGTGKLAPADEASFGFGTSGQIVELDVKIGDRVEAGQVLGKMDDSEVQAAYEQAKRSLADLTTPASIASAQQSVAEAEVDIYNAKQDLEYLISSDVYYWENKVAAAEQTLKDAQAAGGSSPTADQKKNIDDATTALNRTQTNLQAAQLKYINEYVPKTFTYTITDTEDKDNDGNTEETFTEVVAPSPAEIAAARAAYQLAIEKQKEAQAYLDMLNGKALPQDVPGSSLTSLVEAQTSLQTAEQNLKATQLIAPISGTVTSLTANAGDQVDTSSIVTVADLNQPYTIDAYFDAENWANVQAGYGANITFDILPDQIFTGKVITVYPELDSSSSTSLVHATVKLDQGVEAPLPVGASASVDVIGNEATNAVLVPIEAIHVAGGKSLVFVQQGDGKLKLQTVEVGLKDALYAEVKSGLQAGDVVTTGVTEVTQ